MNLTDKSVIKNLLKKYNAKPEKYLGQHFILSKKALNLMITASEIAKNDTIIEIGPGLGTLTHELAKTDANIIAIEKDPLMVEILKETLADYKNIKITEADARKIILPLPDIRRRVKRGKVVDKYHYKYNDKRYKIVANLPYNVATFLIRKWLESKNPPQIMVLMIQKEVAQRICAKSPKMNLLAVSTQFYAIAEIMKYVPKEMFWPRPKVDAAIIKIIPKITWKQGPQVSNKRNDCHLSIACRQLFFKVVKAGFSQPRKQLISNLSKNLIISKEMLISIFKDLDISETARAENLSLNEWKNLANKLIPALEIF